LQIDPTALPASRSHTVEVAKKGVQAIEEPQVIEILVDKIFFLVFLTGSFYDVDVFNSELELFVLGVVLE